MPAEAGSPGAALFQGHQTPFNQHRSLFVSFLPSTTARKRLVRESICLIYWY